MTQAAGDRNGNVWLVGGGELVGQFADCSLLDEVLVGIAR
jgi:dihydrofolate reductase